MMTFDPSCPPARTGDVVQLAHGGGGRTMWRLLHELVRPALSIPASASSEDAALVPLPAAGQLAFTTDATVVSPLFFPGGDLGKLAVCGALNDLACVGARPLALSLCLICEEGLPLTTLKALLDSAQRAAAQAGVAIVTGDTKVVDRGKGDGLYASVSAIGLTPVGVNIGPRAIRPGDVVLVSGDVGRHGIAILSVREGLRFETTIESDCASVGGLVSTWLDAGITPRCLRDPTRGGLAAALNELALDARVAIAIDERLVPVAREVAAACELLGLSPLSMASEGRLLAIVAPEDAEHAVGLWRAAGADTCVIGRVQPEPAGRVLLTTALGTQRVLDFLAGEELPRIC